MKIEHLEKALDRIHDWIKSADHKIGVFLAFQGVIIVILFPYFIKKMLVIDYIFLINFIFLIGIILILWSLYYSVCGIIPKIKNDNAKSYTFFGDIAGMKPDDYFELVNKKNEEDYIKELCNQIVVSSNVSKDKHRKLRLGIIIFIVGVFFVGTAYVLTKIYVS